jgi:hypothetical protein
VRLCALAAASLEFYSADGDRIVFGISGGEGFDGNPGHAAALVAVLFGRITRNHGVVAIVAGALGSSLSFFMITNFMVWAAGRIYPNTLAGLAACFTAAIPFYQNQIAGDAFYTLAIFGGYALLKRSFRPLHQAA